MTTTPRPLRAVPAAPEPRNTESRCTIACQAMVAGPQETSVRVLTPVSGRTTPQIGVRVGGILILIADRPALDSFLDAWHQAEDLAREAFNTKGRPTAPG